MSLWGDGARRKLLFFGVVAAADVSLCRRARVFQAVPARSHFKLVPYAAPTGSRWEKKKNRRENAPNATFSCERASGEMFVVVGA